MIRTVNFSNAAMLSSSGQGSSHVSRPGDRVSLNPQPLPPREGLVKHALKSGAAPSQKGSDRSIIIVGGKADRASLNPQPLPPRDPFSRVRQALGSASSYTPSLGSERGIIVVGG